MALIEVRLRPTGPWRVGHRGGDRERVDVVYHSDALFSAVTHAMRSLGWLDEWLDATARATGEPAVRFSSLFPFTGKTRLIAPPKTAWPPAGRGQLYFEGAKLVPLDVLRHGVQDESRWEVDGECHCLLPVNGVAPFRIVIRHAAAVDRITGATEPHSTACLEFAPNAGWWGVFQTTDKLWESRVKSALRLAADSGFGGERSRGWGRSADPQFNDASHLFPQSTGTNDTWWLLSLYSPDPTDNVDWTRSDQTITVKAGWTGAQQTKQLRMLEEGAVLSAGSIRGRAVDVAPENHPHPVYRSGIALAVPVPVVTEPKKPQPPPPPPADPGETAVHAAEAAFAVEPDNAPELTPSASPTEGQEAVAASAEEPAEAEPTPSPSPTEGHAAIAASAEEPAQAEPTPSPSAPEGQASPEAQLESRPYPHPGPEPEPEPMVTAASVEEPPPAEPTPPPSATEGHAAIAASAEEPAQAEPTPPAPTRDELVAPEPEPQPELPAPPSTPEEPK